MCNLALSSCPPAHLSSASSLLLGLVLLLPPSSTKHHSCLELCRCQTFILWSLLRTTTTRGILFHTSNMSGNPVVLFNDINCGVSPKNFLSLCLTDFSLEEIEVALLLCVLCCLWISCWLQLPGWGCVMQVGQGEEKAEVLLQQKWRLGELWFKWSDRMSALSRIQVSFQW